MKNRAPFVVRIQFEIAEELFGNDIARIKSLQIRSWPNANLRHHPRKLRCVARAVRHRTCHWINNDVLRAGVVLSRVGVLDAENVARAFDYRVLEPSASSQKWPVPPPRELDTLQHAVNALVRAPRRGPKAVEGFECFISAGFCQRWRGQPLRLDCQSELGGGVLERIVGGVMGAELRIEVTENSDANCVGHAAILNGVTRNQTPARVRRLVTRGQV